MVNEAISVLNELKCDPSVNKNIKGRIERIIACLENDIDLGKDKALVEIEEMMDANDMEPYLRTQIWNIISLIERK